MADVETLTERLQTVERAVSDGETELPNAATLGKVESRVDALEDRVEEIGDRTAELEAATQALRGYVGNIRSVNEDVEQRADAALAAVERLEQTLADERGQCDEDARGTPDNGSNRQPGRFESTDDRRPVRPSVNRSESETGYQSETTASSITRNAGSPREVRELEEAIDDRESTDRSDNGRHRSSADAEETGFLARVRELL